jgi:hypothetical protein
VVPADHEPEIAWTSRRDDPRVGVPRQALDDGGGRLSRLGERSPKRRAERRGIDDGTDRACFEALQELEGKLAGPAQRGVGRT